MSRTLLAAGSLSAALALCALPAHAADIGGTDVAVSVGVDYVDEYVFRGFSFADASIQPYVEAGIGNFTIGLWANNPVGDDADFGTDEVDLYASYGFELTDAVSASIGATYYHFPEGGGFFGTDGGATGTYEVSAGLALDNPVSPFVNAYYDFTLEAVTVEGGVEYGIDTGERSSIGLGLTGGYVEADGAGDYGWATASAGWSFALTDDASFNAGVNYSVNTDDNTLGFSVDRSRAIPVQIANDSDNLFWSGIGISAGF